MIHPRKTTRMRSLTRFAERLEGDLARMEAANGRFFWIRLSVLAVGILGSFLAFQWTPPPGGPLALLAFVAAFSVVVFLHRRLDRAMLRFQIARGLALTNVARMRLDWAALPASPPSPTGERPTNGAPSSHPFAADLNLTGARSLHQLLDSAISQGGSRRLREWLLAPTPDPAVIGQRQALLGELLPLTGFRNRLALNGALATSGKHERWDGEKLLAWLQPHGDEKDLRPRLLLLAGLAAINIGLFALFSLRLLPAYWIFSLVAYFVVYYSQYRHLSELFSQAQHLGVTLERFRAVLVYLETYRYPAGSRLGELARAFWSAARRPSRYLRSIAAIASAASLQGNPFVWFIINTVVPWDFYFAHRLNRYKAEMRDLLPAWLDAWYELEALNSLAGFAYLNPGYVFPEIMGAEARPVFEAGRLGHPLIPDEVKVANDYQIDRIGELSLISGSNMSGKSTFLRTLGINLALAYAGGPVDAASLRTIPFRLFTCINVSDSLSDGISYFYAEVRRLKALLEALEVEHAYPLFFLIDEIFRGTNNRERQAGSRAYVQALLGGRGVGLISTHDLELVHLADQNAGIRNFHFREEVEAGRMVFDYTLREGPSPTTNALKIMELEGLPVEEVT